MRIYSPSPQHALHIEYVIVVRCVLFSLCKAETSCFTILDIAKRTWSRLPIAWSEIEQRPARIGRSYTEPMAAILTRLRFMNRTGVSYLGWVLQVGHDVMLAVARQ